MAEQLGTQALERQRQFDGRNTQLPVCDAIRDREIGGRLEPLSLYVWIKVLAATQSCRIC